ncbi:MAG: peptidase S41 [Bacteroidia bacterium]|nr:MAG: peptidase S41 [Bacteroidia bacterium]
MKENKITNQPSNLHNQGISRRIYIYLIPLGVILLIAGIFIGRKLLPHRYVVSQKQILLSSEGKVPLLLDLIQNNYVDKLSADSIEEIALVNILRELDPHSEYLPPQQNQSEHEQLEGSFEGIGIRFNIMEDTVLIINVISGGPSEKAGVLPGDKIVKVNDTLFAGNGITNEKVFRKLKGKKGSTVHLGIKRHGVKELLDFQLKREKIPINSVDVAYMATPEIGYIKISRFGQETYFEFLDAVEKLQTEGMQKLVLDLRDNGGGYLRAAVNIVDEFLPEGELIVYMQGEQREKESFFASENNVLKDLSAVVLINSWSASASEIVAGALQDNDRATIIGRRSFGKGLVQEEFPLSDNSGIRLTVARYYTPSGRCIQKPYNKGVKQYELEVFARSSEGELIHADSTKFADSLKYTTRNGRIVYGGGGIMPDVFVPVDTLYYSPMLDQILKKSLLFKYGLNYADTHRERLKEMSDYQHIESYLDRDGMEHKFKKYITQNGIAFNAKDYKTSRKYILTRLKATIASNILDSEGFYPIIRSVDSDLQKAISVLNNSKEPKKQPEN